MKKNTKFLVNCAMIGAIYTAITFATYFMSYKSVQFRVAEAMIVLTAYTPSAIPGLAIGCFLSNLTSPFGMIDTLLGALVTLVAGCFGYFTRKVTVRNVPVLLPIANVLLNGLYVGLLESFAVGNGKMFWIGFTQVSISELIICYGLGMPLYFLIKKNKKHMDF